MIRHLLVAAAGATLTSCALCPPLTTSTPGPLPTTQTTLPPDPGAHWDASDGCEYPLVRTDVDTCVLAADEPRAVICETPYVYSVAGTCVLHNTSDTPTIGDAAWSGEP